MLVPRAPGAVVADGDAAIAAVEAREGAAEGAAGDRAGARAVGVLREAGEHVTDTGERWQRPASRP